MKTQSHLHIFARARLEPNVVDELRRQFGWPMPPVVLEGAGLSVKDLRVTLNDIAKKPLVGGHIAVVLMNAEAISKEVANTLLKTIEEPPEYLSWHLVTTNELKVISTIVSRCQSYRYAGLPSSGTDAAIDWSQLSLIEKLNWALEMSGDESVSVKMASWLDSARQKKDWTLAQAVDKVLNAIARPSANKRLILENFALRDI